jgi:hypothetical protein
MRGSWVVTGKLFNKNKFQTKVVKKEKAFITLFNKYNINYEAQIQTPDTDINTLTLIII